MIRFQNVRLSAARYAMGGAVLGGSRSRYELVQGAEYSMNPGIIRIGATARNNVAAADGAEGPGPTMHEPGQVQLCEVVWPSGDCD